MPGADVAGAREIIAFLESHPEIAELNASRRRA
jgi:hypothetical protein